MSALNQKPTESPLISKLTKEITHNSDALSQFWNQVEASGLPVIESLDENFKLITFIYKAGSEIKDVTLYTGLVRTLGTDASSILMHQLLDTDLYYCTIKATNLTLITYYFVINASIINSIKDPEQKSQMQSMNWRYDIGNPEKIKLNWQEAFAEPDIPDCYLSILNLTNTSYYKPVDSVTEHDLKGKLIHTIFKSNILQNSRNIWVYLPKNYESLVNVQLPFLILLDGGLAVKKNPQIIEHLVDSGKIKPLIAIFVDNVEKNRTKELQCYPPFAEFIINELLPWARDFYHLTTDPEKIGICGTSFGGLSALYFGIQYPKIFGNIISQSGSHWWNPESQNNKGWIIEHLKSKNPGSIRIFMDIGVYENIKRMKSSNLELRQVLENKGYEFYYEEFFGDHFTNIMLGTIHNGLLSLFA